MNPLGRLRALLYDPLLHRSEIKGLGAHRQALLDRAQGRVLEVGAGTGINLDYYHAGLELVLSEPDAAMLARLRTRAGGRNVEVVQATAERLPFADDSFDTVVATLVLCSVAEPALVLAEIGRVLEPAGRLLLLEHVRSDDPQLARRQDRLARPWRLASGGCRCNRDSVRLVEECGFRFSAIERGKLPAAPAFLRPLVIGEAAPGGLHGGVT